MGVYSDAKNSEAYVKNIHSITKISYIDDILIIIIIIIIK